ncbi:peptidoglycan-binding protein LysM [Flavobacterium silvaticum]|uniref:Peptidoglycan-binding protein LysM n=1 Tax=Flavobacterium silvaticum TaxID=1852020 RepID=A0A972FMN2_9FLAO|nr:peptidoglycan-binding protein LysM [Flavobacterium silvaticum]NMH28030.1 peptidoglycan-binding protein LysM [Flavobacterium silvaticum]
MFTKWAYFAGIFTLVLTLSSGLKPLSISDIEWFHTTHDGLTYSLPSQDKADYSVSTTSLLFPGKIFTAFKEAIAFKESQGQYRLVNSYGYMGKYQFGKTALRAIGIKDYSNFLKNPELQERAFVALCAKNKYELRNEIQKYDGKVVGGVKVTESGMLAAAHLLGAGSVKKYLKSNGNTRIRDGYGTSLRSYMRNYGGYETSQIEADANAMARM